MGSGLKCAGRSTTTNSSGYFQITNVSSGDYYLMVSKIDYQTKRDPGSGSFGVACAETENRGTIYLSCSPPETPTSLTGIWVAGQPSNHPQITWNSVSGAAGYKVCKSNDEMFASCLP